MTTVPFYQRHPLAVVIGTLALIVVLALVFSAAFKSARANDVIAYPTNNAGWSICQGPVCVWGDGLLPNPYVRTVPPPADPAAAAERERKWIADCKPTLARDHYGVMRYQYAKAGCEFGSPE